MFFSIFNGFFRRLIAWMGLGIDPVSFLLILPVFSGVILVKVFLLESKSATRVTGSRSYAWIFTALTIFVGSFFPLSENVLGPIISSLAFLPLVVFLVVGIKFGDSIDLYKITKDIMVYAILNTAYCTYQLIFGFPIWDSNWIESSVSSGYFALTIYGSPRPFGVLTSPAESSTFLAISFFLLLTVNAHFGKWKSQIAAVMASVSLFVLLSVNVRTTIILTVIAIFLNFKALVFKRKIHEFLLSTFLLILPIFFFMRDNNAFQRTVEAFVNPTQVASLQVRQSTSQTVMADLSSHPLGHGLGVLVNGSAKFGGYSPRSTDVVFADTAVSLGFLGIVLSVFVSWKCISNVFTFKNILPVWLVLVPFLNLNYNFNPNHYSTTPLAWLVLGICANKLISINFPKKHIFRHTS